MTATTSILDADMATLARWSRSGFDWWRDELAAMVPPRLRRALSPRPAVVARFDGQGFMLSRQGRAVANARGPVAVAVPAAMVLVRGVRLPALGQADLRRLVAFDAERLLPFPAGTALLDLEAGPRDADGLATVAIAALPRDRAEAIIMTANAAGLEIGQLGVVEPDGGVRFDFLPAWRAVSGAAAANPRRFWWAVVAAVFVANLGLMIGRDVYDLRQTEELVDTHGQSAATARTLRARVVAEDARRRTLLTRRERQDPLPILSAAGRALPDTAWVQRLAWDGTTLRLTGFKGGNLDVVAALRRSPNFTAVRSASVEVSSQPGAGQPFDVTAETGTQTVAGARQ